MAETPEKTPQTPSWPERITPWASAIAVLISTAVALWASVKDLPFLQSIPALIWWSIPLALVAFWLLRWLIARQRRLKNLVIKKPGELKIPETEFQGRNDDVDRIIRQLLKNNVFCLLGESGCGKTTLVARGLARDPRITARFELVTVDAYGSDWIAGPVRALGAALNLERDRTARGENDLTRLLRRWKKEIADRKPPAHRPLLLVFDQFDQYLAASHEHLVREGLFIDQATLTGANPLWEMIFQLAREETVKCLFVIEKNQGLLALPFFAGAAVAGLDRLGPGYAREFLLECLERAEGPITDSDFADLVRRIAQDLEKGGLLPVQLDFALRGLPYLRPPTLRSYRRVGELPGLVALGIQRQIESDAQLRGISYPEALALLGHLTTGDKLQERSLDELAEALEPRRSRETLEELLREWERRRITRSCLDASAAPAWTLYHEFLVEVLAALREKTRQQEAFLRDALEKYRTSLSPMGKMRSLLAPWTALLYLVGRRGRVRIPEARGFLLWSFFVWSAAVLLIVFAVGKGYVWWRSEKIGAELALRFDSSSNLDRQEIEAIWRLYDEWDSVKRKALATLLESEASAQRFDEHGEVILQSLNELKPDEMQESLEAVWRERCWERIQDLEIYGLRSCARIEDELPTSTLETWDRYLLMYAPNDLLVSLFEKLPDEGRESALGILAQRISSREVYQEGTVVAALLSRTSREVRERRIEDLLAGFVKQGNARELLRLRKALREAGHLELDGRIEMAGRQIIASSRETSEPLQWARDVASLQQEGWKPGSNVREEARSRLLASLVGNLSPQEKIGVMTYLTSFAGDLTEADLARSRDAFAAALSDCDARRVWTFIEIPWLSNVLGEGEALGVIERLEQRPFTGSDEWWVQKPARADAVKSLGALIGRLKGSERGRKRGEIWNRLRETDELKKAVHLLVLLGAFDLAERKSDLISNELLAELLRFIGTDEQSLNSADGLAVVAESWWPYLSPSGKRQLADSLHHLYQFSLRQGGTQYWKTRVADLLNQLRIILPAAESEATLNRILKSSDPPCDALAPLARKENLRLLVEQGFRHPACPLGISESVLEKLDRSGVLPIEKIGERINGKPRADRRKLAAWARENGYDLEGPLLFGGALY